MKDLIRRFLNAKTSPFWVAMFIIINGGIIVYAVNYRPVLATIIIIFVTLILALFIFSVAFIGINDEYRISPLVNQQYYVYEVLHSVLQWEIVAEDGSLAKLTKTRTIRFIDNEISTLREYIWGDVYSSRTTPAKSDITVSPGFVSQIYAEGGRFVVVITLDRVYNKHETLNTQYERKIRNGFMQNKEWVEFVPVTNSKNEIMKVVTPKSRPVREARARFRRGDYSECYMVGNEGFTRIVEDNKDILEWNIRNPIPRASYLIEWEW